MNGAASSPAAERPAGRVQRVRHELKRRALTVRRVETVSPHVRRITFGGEDLADFVSLSFDDHVKLFVPVAEGEAPVARDYTPLAFDTAARELVIEFALHGDGPAARWAAQAVAGEAVQVGGPRGSFVVEPALDWHLLIGDDSALPAIARRLAELPASTQAWVIVRLPDPADRRPLHSAADLRLQWVDDDAGLLAAARALPLPPGEGYAWCAGEAGLMAALRRVLVEERGVARHALRAAAYWKHDVPAHHAPLDD